MAKPTYYEYGDYMADKYGIPREVVRAIMHIETRGGANTDVSSAGARGPMQLMPDTAKELGVRNIDDPAQNIEGGVKYLAQQYKQFGNWDDVAAAYHSGGGRIDRGRVDYANLGPKGQQYVRDFQALVPESVLSQAASPAQAAPGPQGVVESTGDPLEGEWAGPVAAAPAGGDPLEGDWDQAANAAPSQGVPALSEAPKLKSDELLGMQRGFFKPMDNLALWAERGVDALGRPFGNEDLGQDISRIGGGKPMAEVIADRQAYVDAQRAKGVKPGLAGEIVGGIAGTLPAIAAVPGAGLGSAVLGGAAAGAMMTDDPEDLGSVVGDAAIGAAGGGVLHGAGRIIAPRINAALRNVRNTFGANPTPGQALGGPFRVWEDLSESIPGYGLAIRAGKRGANAEMNRGAANFVMNNIDEVVPDTVPIGTDQNQYVKQTIGDVYNTALRPVVLPWDNQLAADLGTVRQQIVARLSPDNQAAYADLMANHVMPRLQANNTMSGEGWKEVQSILRKEARDTSKKGGVEANALANAFGATEGAMGQGWLARYAPDAADTIRAADQSYAKNIALKGASARAPGGDDGVFSPSNLWQASKAADPTYKKEATALGTSMWHQPLTDLMDVMGRYTPNSGTADRAYHIGGVAALGGGLLGADAAGVPVSETLEKHPVTAGLLATAAGGSAALQTPTGRRLFSGLLAAERPRVVQQVIDRLSGAPFGVAGGVMAVTPTNATPAPAPEPVLVPEPVVEEPPMGPPIEVNVTRSTHPDYLEWRRQQGLPPQQ